MPSDFPRHDRRVPADPNPDFLIQQAFRESAGDLGMPGGPGHLMSPQEAEAAPRIGRIPAQEQHVTECFNHHIVGSPATVKAGLEDLAERTGGASEIMIANITHAYGIRLKSFELIAEANRAQTRTPLRRRPRTRDYRVRVIDLCST
ncbi:hypothetical protein [Micromonospora sp. WMMD736]|uniref:hypothetical protein n=1 Tax=Micromonospora sp. WMMD736 TaxID=3404112 RepID=UPI003B93EF55